jgi:energy-converting hydrogenase Eha subunit E
LLGGLAWAFFASSHWTGSRAAILAVSGVMLGAGASTALYLPVLRTLSTGRRVMGMSLVGYSYISIFFAITIAVALAITAALMRPE